MKAGRAGHAVAILTALSLLSSCDRRAPLLQLDVRDVPASRVGAATRILAMDALVDDRQVLHVVWRAVKPGVEERPEVWHQSSPDYGRTWGRPRMLERELGTGVRCIQAAGEVHVIAGGSLDDYATTDDGSTWVDCGPLLERDELGHLSQSFDAAAGDADLCAVSTRWHSLPDSAHVWGRGYNELWLTRRTGVSTRRTLIPGYRGGLPVLKVKGTTVLIACARTVDRREVRTEPGVGEVGYNWVEGQVDVFRSSDGGEHWSGPVGLPPPRGATHWSEVRQVRWIEMPGGPCVLMNSGGALHLITVRSDTLDYPVWIPNVLAYEMDSMNDRAFTTTRNATSGMIASLADIESPFSEFTGARPSDVRVARLSVRRDSIVVGAARRLTSGNDEVLEAELIETPRGPLVIWRVIRRAPLLRGAGRIDRRIRFTLIDQAALAAPAAN